MPQLEFLMAFEKQLMEILKLISEYRASVAANEVGLQTNKQA